MKIVQSSDYRIYFDNVRMDEYVKTWNAACGLRASDATASITMYRTKELEQWKGYLTQVRVFARNIFSGKFGMVFEGEIMNRSWGEQRANTGEITFFCKGFYHWLDIPIPLMINTEEALDLVQQFRYEAMNIDVDAVTEFFMTNEELIMKDKYLNELIRTLFERMNEGYYLEADSTFAWANLEERFKVMGDVIKEFRQAGYIDSFTFTRTTQIESFYVYLTQVLTQLMFEFYQDRDGAFRIKTPSWKDDILKAHILDESVVRNANGFNDWENEPTRVLVIGGHQDVQQSMRATGPGNTLKIPMGLYIGQPGEGEYFSQAFEVYREKYGTENDYSGGSGPFYDDITGNYPVTSPYGPRSVKLSDGTVSNKHHNGTDYGMTYVPLNSQGVDGEVVLANYGSASAGNWIIVKERISGKDYYFTYMHLSEIQVSVGDTVKAGEQIGVTGNTGQTNGPHLHLEIRNGMTKADGFHDPEVFLKEMKESVASTQASGGGDFKAVQGLSKYDDIINEAGAKYDIDPYFIAAIIQQESGFDFDAGSSAGARGLMQLMPATAKGLGVTDITDPRQNVMAGTKFMDQMLRGQNEDVILALAAYNAGPGNVRKYGGVPPFDETQDYVKKVPAHYKAYTGRDAKNGVRGGASIAPSSPSSPNAMTGGYGMPSVRVRPIGEKMAAVDEIKEDIEPEERLEDEAVTVDYQAFATDKFTYPVPIQANYYKDYIANRPNGVNANMICSIIYNMSNWKEKFSTDKRVGLMGVPVDYANDRAGGTAKMFLPETNIQHATSLFKSALERFSNKPTFALAALYEGDLSNIEDYIEEAGVEDFSKVREYMSNSTVAFVVMAVETFCELYDADYIKGDPHKTFRVGFGGIDEGAAEDTEVKEYEKAYKPIMSDEERLFKVNLKVSEQLLIRYDTEQNGALMNADELVERYARYMMQLYRAESHGVNVPLSTCLPFLRPGYNAWLEPTRRDMVFYITKVSHQGSFGNGAFSTVTGGYVRDPDTYDDIEENIFIGETNASASDFGETIDKSGMSKIRKELSSLHASDEKIGDARKVPTLNKLYSSSGGKETDYSTSWNGEYTSSELDKKVNKLYEDAPKIVKNRRDNLLDVVEKSEAFFKKMLLNTSF